MKTSSEVCAFVSLSLSKTMCGGFNWPTHKPFDKLRVTNTQRPFDSTDGLRLRGQRSTLPFDVAQGKLKTQGDNFSKSCTVSVFCMVEASDPSYRRDDNRADYWYQPFNLIGC